MKKILRKCIWPALTVSALFLGMFAGTALAAEDGVYEISRKDAEAKLSTLLVKAGEGEKFKINFFGINQEKLFLSGKPVSLDVENFDYDKTTSRFTALFKYKNDAEVVGSKEVGGRFEEIISVPALKHRMGPGALITEEDISSVDVPSHNLRGGVAKEPEDLIGKTVSRSVSQLRPIMLSEIKDPALVKKDDLVTLVYRQGRVEIKTQGVAQNEGAIGKYVQVKNAKSGITLRGKVEGNGIVMVEGLDNNLQNSSKISSVEGVENENR